MEDDSRWVLRSWTWRGVASSSIQGGGAVMSSEDLVGVGSARDTLGRWAWVLLRVPQTMERTGARVSKGGREGCFTGLVLFLL